MNCSKQRGKNKRLVLKEPISVSQITFPDILIIVFFNEPQQAKEKNRKLVLRAPKEISN